VFLFSQFESVNLILLGCIKTKLKKNIVEHYINVGSYKMPLSISPVILISLEIVSFLVVDGNRSPKSIHNFPLYGSLAVHMNYTTTLLVLSTIPTPLYINRV